MLFFYDSFTLVDPFLFVKADLVFPWFEAFAGYRYTGTGIGML